MEEQKLNFTCPKCWEILKNKTKKEIEDHFKKKHKDVKKLNFGREEVKINEKTRR